MFSDICFLDIDAGPCDTMQTRFAYDRKLGRCVTFEYGGCAGNQNNFPDLEYCSFYCHPIQGNFLIKTSVLLEFAKSFSLFRKCI